MAGVRDTSESSASILSRIEKCVECPVCLETAKVPFKLCSSGHIVCLSCTTKTHACPTCKRKFTEEYPVCLRNILEVLPRYRCVFSQDGCQEMLERNNDHEAFCGYRPIECGVPKYSIIMPVVKVLDHYKEHHGNVRIITERSVEGLTFADLQEYTPVSLFDHLFWILKILSRDDSSVQPDLLSWGPSRQGSPHRTHGGIGTMAGLSLQRPPPKDACYKIYFLATPIGKLNHDYYVRVMMENGGFVETNTLKARVSSFDRMPSFQHTYGGETIISGYREKFMKIPLRQVEEWLSKTNKELKVELFFFNDNQC